MPPNPSGSKHPVVREIHIFETTTIADAVRGSRAGFYTTIATPLVATVNSNRDGTYTAPLAPGNYSVFVKEDGDYYANLVETGNVINPVTVVAGQVAIFDIDIKHDTVW